MGKALRCFLQILLSVACKHLFKIRNENLRIRLNWGLGSDALIVA